MNYSKYIASLILLLVGFTALAQTPEKLIRGNGSGQDITSQPIRSSNWQANLAPKEAPSQTETPSVARSSSQVGTTPAQFSVSLSGGASYNIPIATPPGVRNISPDLGINFNSQASNGIAGWGWGISGLSAISRVSSTKFHDDEVDGVDFDGSDRFSLDGQRLLLKSGTYGAANSEYQTETYSNVKIKAYGTSPYGASYGPSYFIVFFPDGSRAWYGNAAYSRSRMEWSIFKKTDAQGNIIQYEYATDGELRMINRVIFGHRTGTAPVEVKFYYKTRKRPELAYVKGITFKRTKIIDRIEVKGNGQLFRKYVLGHNETSLGYQRLTSVTEYNKVGQSLTPITFSYDNASASLNPDTYSGTIYPGYNYDTDNILSGEFNGDGNLDFILYNKNTRNKIHVFDDIYDGYNNTELGRTYNVSNFDEVIGNSMLNHQGKALAQQGITFIKENISGYSGVVDFKSYYHGAVSLYYHYTKTWNAPTYGYDNSCSSSVRKKIPKEYVSGDFNGDGLTDVLAIQKPYFVRYCQTYECDNGGGGPWDEIPRAPRAGESDEDFNLRKLAYQRAKDNDLSLRPPIEIIDPGDGDGGGGGGTGTCCSCGSYTSNTKYAYFIDLNRNLTTSFVNGAGSLQETIKSNDRVLAADFNGDGKTDLFHFTEGKAYVYELNSNNQLTLIHQETDSYIKMNYPILLGDYNGDGKTDFLTPTANNSKNWRFFLSRGTNINKYTKYLNLITFVESQVSANYNYTQGPTTNAIIEFKFIAQDVNGDGKTDLIKHAIASAYSTNHSYSDDIVNIHVNKFGETDTTPSFQHTSNYTRANSGVTRFGVPIFLASHMNTDNIEYAYISANHLAAYEFDGNHRRDVTLQQINNNGTTHIIDYHGLGQDDDYVQVYSPKYDEVYPFTNVNVAPSLKLVEKVREIGGGMTRTQDYRYTGAVSHATGLGFIGYVQTKKTNLYGSGVQQLWSITDHDTQKRGAPSRNWVSTSPSSSPYSYASKEDFTYQTELTADKVFVNVQSQVVSEDALSNVTTTKTFTYDSYYNPTQISTTFPGGSKTVNQTFVNNAAPFNQTYAIGRLTQKVSSNTLSGNTFTSEEQYTYNNNLVTLVKKKGEGTPWLNEHYQYDAFGNVLQKKITGSGIGDRIENFQFDSSGRYMLKSIDAEGLETTYLYNTATGNPTKVTNPYGLPINYAYDNWGRVTSETDYLGKTTTTSYANTSTTGTGGTLKTINYNQGEDEKVYYNAFGWVMKESIMSLNGKWITKSYEYDVAGRKTKESEPYFSTSSPTQWNQYSFDQYGRTISQQLHTGRIVTTTYNGLSATVDDGAQTVTSTKNAVGNIVSITDNGGTVNYTYFANGKMKTADYGGHMISVSIDGWGRKKAMTDPSAGSYTYQYNIVGDLLQETTPKGTTNYTYSPIGKLLAKEIQGDNTHMITNYTYDAATKLLKNVSAIDQENGISYDYNYFYDGNKRINKVTENNGTALFELQKTYDSYGRVDKEVYITNETTIGNSNTVTTKNVYDTSSGILEEIRDFNSNSRLWRVNTENARGDALSITLGNGMIKTKSYDQYGYLTNIYDRKIPLHLDGTPPPDPVVALKLDYDFDTQRGILNSRKNYAFTNWDENFTYDSQNRLTEISGAVSHTQQYDAKGRIVNNSFVGAYNYTSSSSYQLANVDLNNQGDLFFQQQPLQQITYNAFKKPLEIYQEGNGRVSFRYGPMMNRTNAYYGGLQTNATQRRYHKQYSSIMPVEVVNDSETNTTKIITYIGGDEYSAPVAQIKKTGTSAINEYHYLHRDYLGSIMAISNASTEVVEQRQFGAWGIVDGYNEAGSNATFSNESLIDRGFTGHEHFFDVSLVHMNGRMYDANLGRFLSPDNFVQDPYNTQSFNRYGYVWNNPLSYNDPTGEIVWVAVLVGVIVGAVSGAAAYIGQAIQTGNWSWGGFAMAVLGGAIVGGITYGIAPSLVWSTSSLLTIAAAGFVSSFLPSFTIPIGDWSISISPSIAFGNASGIGANLSIGYSDGNWSFSAGIGYMNYGNYHGFGNGTEIRTSILAAYDDGKTGFSYGTNWWRGKGGMAEFKQRTGVVGLRFGDFRVRYENDGSIGFAGDKGDSFRTASLFLSVGDFSVGFQFFTGFRDLEAEKELPGGYKGVPGTNYKDSFGRNLPNGPAIEGTPHRLGSLTFGYKGYKIGVNSEKVRHAIQNHAIHNLRVSVLGLTLDKRQRGFENQSWDWKGYFHHKTPNEFTAW